MFVCYTVSFHIKANAYLTKHLLIMSNWMTGLFEHHRFSWHLSQQQIAPVFVARNGSELVQLGPFVARQRQLPLQHDTGC